MSTLVKDLASRDRAAQMRPVAEPSTADARSLEQHVHDLLATLNALQQMLGQLLDLAVRKLAAMRHADTGALHKCAAEESVVLHALFEKEKERDAVIARLAQSLPLPEGGPLRLSHIAERLPEPLGSRLRAKTLGLRQVAGALQEKNRLAARVARNLHTHICAVFEDVAKVNQESVVYGPSGKHEQRNKETWVDAVG
jgi:hypothetical protein